MVNRWNLIVCPERATKQGVVMQAMRAGMGGAGVVRMNDQDPRVPFMISGQLWAVQRMVPEAKKRGTPFWIVDNGYYLQSGKGRHETGHWELTYRGLEPIYMADPDYSRIRYEDHVEDWKTRRGDYILVGIPGLTFGRILGLDMKAWVDTIEDRIRQHTDRPIRIRTKWSKSTVEDDVRGAHCLVTHSSHVAIDALRLGVPAIVAPTSPAAPVCSHSLEDIESPPMPDRRRWWASLMCQQFTREELRSGLAWHWQKRVMEERDGDRA